METFEMKYFLGVARTQNVHRASEELHVSPGSLSKAISRLEEELKVKLFSRDGRGIRLTEAGKILQRRASEIIHLEESTRTELAGAKGALVIRLSGPEILLMKWGLDLSKKMKLKFPLAKIELVCVSDKEALDQVEKGEAHIAFVTDASTHGNLTAKVVGESLFKTFVGKSHILNKKRKPIEIQDLLLHAFVSPGQSFLGKVGARQSLDGWRDDQYQRRIDFIPSSFKVLEEIVLSGQAVAYLPDYLGENLKLEEIDVLGCPFSCHQKIKMVARSPREHSWLNGIF